MSGIILPFKNLRLRVGGFMLLLLSAFSSMAQIARSENVGIGTTKPDISAILDLTSNSKGLLIPRMTLAQRGNIKSPANGLMVYQTDFFSGFYFFDGLNWKGLYARSSEGAAITTETTNENSWNINGNSGLNSDINFIGTLDTTSLVFKVNNYRSGLIDYRFGNTYFGYRAGYRSHGFNSVAIGAYALNDANLGLNNIAIGYQSLPSNKNGSDNIALGSNALYSNITGSQNISIGTQAGLRLE
jgi:trimeric autotransporter adhesin